MDCPTEERMIRERLAQAPGVRGLEFDLAGRTLALQHAPGALEPARETLRAAGFQTEMIEMPAGAAREQEDRDGVAAGTWWRIGLAAALALGSEAAQWLSGGNTWLVVVLAFAAILLGGFETYQKGWAALRRGNLNMNALMSVAVTGALAIGEFPEAAVVMVLFGLAELIEALSYERARDAIRGLLEMAPDTALVRIDGAEWSERPAAQVPLGATVRVRPGARVPLDGVITAGNSTLDQAPITGESLPVDKAPGDPVFAGTINQSAEIDFRVTALAADSTLARIIHVVEEAQHSRAPTQRFVDAFARVYTPIVFAAALLVAAVPPIFLGAALVPWLYKALVLLVIACPCALVISTPVTVVSGLAAAARRGILVKGGVYLELARKLKVLALDKTGTLTEGKPAVSDFRAIGAASREGALRIAASLAVRSDHPVSAAVATHYRSRNGSTPLLEVERFEALAGRGVRGAIGGASYALGNHRLAEELRVCGPDVEAVLERFEAKGQTAVVLADERSVLAVFAVADRLRETSRDAVRELHALGVRTAILSGDNPRTVRAIADAVGIDDARGNLLPEDKLRAVEALAAEHGTLGVAGDGINDAPALAKADIGFAMGAAGSDIAIETAHVALMDDDLRKIPALIRLSRRTAAILAQNIFLALGIKAVFLALALAGMATMWMAVFADMGASLIVVANGLRLIRAVR
ncbi:MAG: 4-deoxy-4-formamido-L-arabinose-phospho-UDP deformylase [Betaproteobacteria bacterium RIFCSPLOWO2_12_FULL_67_28]|nr:MAG: 4-deoxy-4-formamido-L-arabinose-phospho-UDP deformylase [Betaproteobacteria bacterium RIFCSPLOWO2_12_FULL_67_28]